MKQYIYKVIAISLIVCVCTMLGGCRNEKYADISEDKLLIVTTLFPQYDFAKQLAGDRAEVILLLPPGVEAHDFEPTPSDIVLINKADLFIYTGDEMEPWASSIINSIDNKKLKVLDVSKGIDFIEEDENHDHNNVHDIVFSEDGEAEHSEAEHSEEHGHEFDPHIWTSPINAMKMVENVADALVELDSSNKDIYYEARDKYLHELSIIDSDFRDIVGGSDNHTIFFGGRFALSYFAEEYGLTYAAAFDSCQAEAEPSAKLIVKIIDKMREVGAKHIFYEEMTDPKASRIIAEEIDGEILLLHSCHNVSRDEMNNGATYISLMKQNVINLRKALND